MGGGQGHDGDERAEHPALAAVDAAGVCHLQLRVPGPVELLAWLGRRAEERTAPHASADRPRDAKWLAASERTEIEERLATEQAGVPKVAGYREAFKSWNVHVLSVQYAL